MICDERRWRNVRNHKQKHCSGRAKCKRNRNSLFAVGLWSTTKLKRRRVVVFRSSSSTHHCSLFYLNLLAALLNLLPPRPPLWAIRSQNIRAHKRLMRRSSLGVGGPELAYQRLFCFCFLQLYKPHAPSVLLLKLVKFGARLLVQIGGRPWHLAWRNLSLGDLGDSLSFNGQWNFDISNQI